jgi:transcription elongation factor Elf1
VISRFKIGSMPSTLSDVVRCPLCHSAAVVYSCEPKCCFNHVCGECRASFQLVTRKTGRFDRASAIAPAEPASGDPTAACAACESLKLALLSTTAENQATLLCGDCRAVLELAIEDLAPGS